jgi:hypothetical protein
LIISNVGLRRLRKGLLSDLSMLVKIAKQLQDNVQVNEENIVFELLNELILKGLKVVERAVRFHDIWIESESNLSIGGSRRPLTPPENDPQAVSGADRPGIDHIAGLTPRDRTLSLPESQDGGSQISEINTSRMSTATFQSGAGSQDAGAAPVQPGPSAQPGAAQSDSTTGIGNRLSVSHRLSYLGAGKNSGVQKQNLASERLAAAHDSFLSLLGTFIGLHINSRSSHELAVTTHQAVQACRLLIAVVEKIWARDGRRPDSLQAARDFMYQKLADLVQTAKDMLSTAQHGDEILSPDQGKHLVMTTRNCVRAAGDCVAKARQTIERIGDFEFEANAVGLADQIIEALNQSKSPAPSEQQHERTVSSLSTDKPLPVPPEPTGKPPPPPSLSLNTTTKPLPEPPQLSPLFSPDTTEASDTFPDSPIETSQRSSQSSTTPQTIAPPAIHHESTPSNATTTSVSPPQQSLEFNRMPRTDSVNTSATSATDTVSSWRNSNTYGASSVSVASTRATTPDRSPVHRHNDSVMMNSVGSVSELQSVASEELAAEEQVMETTFAHELIPSKDGQVLGGSLPSLIERLTTHDSTPDATFVTTFFLTFRLFTTPMEFAQGLVQRFDYIGDSLAVGVPVRLRVYNVFKGWLETHWQPDADSEVLPVIIDFANTKLAAVLPNVVPRINDLINKVSERRDGAIVPRMVSSLGKNSTSVTSFTSLDSGIPSPIITKSQLNSLRQARVGGNQCTIMDFDPLELARQFTIIESRIFCSIQPEELLALEWTKKSDSKAVNVRAMSTLSTDLANLVADTILQCEEPKKRAIIIKQWVKISMKCLELNNYDSLMAIVCSLNSSMVLRLKKTWELVSQKTKTRWDELCAIVHVGKNHQALRERLKNLVAPCIPFVGLYLTDLTFVHAGNPASRELPGSEPKRYVINFDRYVKTARTIGQLQRFQQPYKLAAVPELQEWMEAQIQRIRESETANVQSFYRKSLLLEPREQQGANGGPVKAKTHWYSGGIGGGGSSSNVQKLAEQFGNTVQVAAPAIISMPSQNPQQVQQQQQQQTQMQAMHPVQAPPMQQPQQQDELPPASQDPPAIPPRAEGRHSPKESSSSNGAPVAPAPSSMSGSFSGKFDILQALSLTKSNDREPKIGSPP